MSIREGTLKMKQVNGEVRLLIIMTLMFVFLVPVGFLVITTSSDFHNQDDILDTGGAIEETETDHNSTDDSTEAEDAETSDTEDSDDVETDDAVEANSNNAPDESATDDETQLE